LSVRILITTKTNETPGEKEHTQSMYPLNQFKTLVSCGRDPARSLPSRRGFLLIPLILVSFALCQQVQAAPSPETPDPGAKPLSNTADGANALLSITTGLYNSGFGFDAALSNSTASFNTGLGAGALLLNNANENTAVGAGALLTNSSGINNTACGTFALFSNSVGEDNNAVGANSLLFNTTGDVNNALGESALFSNTTGAANTAVGDIALSSGSGDDFSLNTAVGEAALASSTAGNSNNAVGAEALVNDDSVGFNNAFGVFALVDNVSGDSNTAVGDSAGIGNTSGFGNIYIGAFTETVPDGESLTIRIGDLPGGLNFPTACFIGGISGVVVAGDPVLVDANGQLGVGPADSPLSMKEILKERQVVQELKATTERQAAVIALQEWQIKALTAGLKQQADQIQKVSAQLEMIRPTPRVVGNR
jgi:hypothetical protein